MLNLKPTLTRLTLFILWRNNPTNKYLIETYLTLGGRLFLDFYGYKWEILELGASVRLSPDNKEYIFEYDVLNCLPCEDYGLSYVES
jgi:hypothetical protein